jgi:hypothetical protein
MVSLGNGLTCLCLAVATALCVVGEARAAAFPPLTACGVGSTTAFSQVPPVRLIAAQVRHVEPADLTFHGSTTVDGGIQVEGRGGDLLFRKKVLQDGRFTLELEGRRDRVVVEVNHDTIAVVRNRRRIVVNVASEPEEGLAVTQGLLAGSHAVRLLRQAATAIQDAEEDSAASASLLVADALVGMLTGDVGAPGRVARHLARHARARVRRAAMQTDCYYSWEQATLAASYEWESCARAFSVWNPTRHLCALRWAIQVESYWFTFLSCTGFSSF